MRGPRCPVCTLPASVDVPVAFAAGMSLAVYAVCTSGNTTDGIASALQLMCPEHRDTTERMMALWADEVTS